MKSRILTSVMSLIAMLAALCGPVQLEGQNQPDKPKVARYTVVNLDTLGGNFSGGSGINNRGLITGWASLPDDTTVHAAAWMNESILDLRTLGGPNSAVIWPVKDDRGLIAGIAETPDDDPYKENWSCSAFFPSVTHKVCRGFLWQNGVMTALPTLGGTHGYASAVNNRGQVVGWAENTVQDPTCVFPQIFQFRAVMWDLQGHVLELPPVAGDTTSAATAINDQGQVVGISGICDRSVGRFSAIHAVLWQDSIVKDIGNLGGIAWNTPTAINNRGHVVGFANLPGPSTAPRRAFLWTNSGAPPENLDMLLGDVASFAWGINDRDQVVGQSVGADGSRAVLWQDGVMTDLNSLLPPGSPRVEYANDINNRGEITGGACIRCDGTDALAVRLIPTFVGSSSDDSILKVQPQSSSRKGGLPEHVRKQLGKRMALDPSDDQ